MTNNVDNVARIYLGGVLGAGKHALVSIEDFPLLSKYSWHLNKSGYAITKINFLFVMIKLYITI